MCLDVLSNGLIHRRNKEEYKRLFYRISKDNLFVSSRLSIGKFSMREKVLWKLAVEEKQCAFSFVWWVIQKISRLKKMLVG